MSSRDQIRLQREVKILRVMKNVEGHLSPKDAKRLAWLDEQLSRPPPLVEATGVPELSEKEEPQADPDQEETVIGPVSDSAGSGRPGLESVSMDDLFTDSVVARISTGTGVVPIELPSKGGHSALEPNDMQGPRQAIVHEKSGLTRRGMVEWTDNDAEVILLDPGQGAGAQGRELEIGSLKKIILMLPDSLARPEKRGRKVSLQLRDGHMMEGFTPDYEPDSKAFTLLPKSDKYIERVIVFHSAVKFVTFEDSEDG